MVSIELLKRWQKFGFAKSTTGSAELRRLIQEELQYLPAYKNLYLRTC